MKNLCYRIIAALVGIIVMLTLFLATKPAEIIEVEKEKVVEVYKNPAYTYNVSSVEREMLARLVYLEANTEGLECQMAVASVVINRWQNGFWGDTIASVIYYPYQFSPAGLIYKTTPTETNYAAVDQVLRSGSILPAHVMYFRSDFGFSKMWDGYAEYSKVGNMYFGYFLVDKK